MIYELALISVVIGAGYWGAFFLRQRPQGTLTFGLMQLGAAALAGLGLLGRHYEADWLGVAGAIGLGAGACLLVVGPVARVIARKLIAAERPRLAGPLFDLAELLAPGSGVAEEKAVVRAMTEVRAGRIEPSIEALTAARQRAPADAQLAIDEQIAMLYLSAHRWADAVQYAEAHQLLALPSTPDASSLRAALGIAPPVWVELLGAYGRIGDLDQAARMLARLEDVCRNRDGAGAWIHHGRVTFLALAGRIDAVRALVAPRQARHMSAAARTYWLAVAHDHHGDRAEAARVYARARARTRGRPRALIDEALATIAGAPVAAPVELSPIAREVAAAVEAAPLPPPVRRTRQRGSPATWLLAGALVAAAAAGTVGIGDLGDLGVLVRSGALVRSMVTGGEWWRIIACIFVHAGALHLLLNAAGLVMIGRLTEQLFGGVRVIAVFAISGLAGALASYFAEPIGITAGASGAVFGLLGAVLVEIGWHRKHYRAAWRQGIWGGLAVVTVGQLLFGFFYPVIDQWAHGAGLVAGAVLGLVLSPSARWSTVAGYAAAALSIGFAAAVVVAGLFVVRAPLADSLVTGGTTHRLVGDLAITAPTSWTITPDDAPPAPPPVLIQQPEGLVTVMLAQRPGTATADRAAWYAEVAGRVKSDLGELTRARSSLIAVPAGWECVELVGATSDAMGDRQSYRAIACSRAVSGHLIVSAVFVPETVARDAAELFAQLLASIGPA